MRRDLAAVQDEIDRFQTGTPPTMARSEHSVERKKELLRRLEA